MHYAAPYSLIGDSNIALHLHPDHLADLRASGLSRETIHAAGVYSISPSDFLEFFSGRSTLGKDLRAKVLTALAFPYQGHSFARIKLFPALAKMKYSQPLGTAARLYIPFPVSDGPLYVVEGEKKTLAAHQAGLNAVGIGGIWTWLNRGEPIDDLNLIQWQNREAIIIPDSDVFERVELLRAVYALGRELRSREALVSVAQIPQAVAVKTGLDDFLISGGRIADLEIRGLGQRCFQSVQFWYGAWRAKKILAA
jgi:hypothetical protein